MQVSLWFTSRTETQQEKEQLQGKKQQQQQKKEKTRQKATNILCQLLLLIRVKEAVINWEYLEAWCGINLTRSYMQSTCNGSHW